MRARLKVILRGLLDERVAVAAEADTAADLALEAAGDPAGQTHEQARQRHEAIAGNLSRAAELVRAAIQELDYRAQQQERERRAGLEQTRVQVLEGEVRDMGTALADLTAERNALARQVVALIPTEPPSP